MSHSGSNARSHNVATQEVTPFLKWAGGKRWLVTKYPRIFPTEYNRYIEPFLGGGATFFYLRPPSAILSDINAQLIHTYQAIRNDWQSVQAALARHQRKHSLEYYYEERKRVRRTPAERAAQFLYLNRTCWNGLYRVNLKGEFNVPKGTKNKVILESDNFAQVSKVLSKSRILCEDFENTLLEASKGDFVFLDPPYTVKHNLNGFVKYNEKLFTWNDQIRLANAVRELAARDVKVLIMNADHNSVSDLYRDFGKISRVGRYSVISGDASARVKTSELAITINYDRTEQVYV